MDADLLLEDVNEWVDCYSFFHEMMDNSGVPVSANSGFYFLDNLTGRISYLGWWFMSLMNTLMKKPFSFHLTAN
jgi:hypothetical protein